MNRLVIVVAALVAVVVIVALLVMAPFRSGLSVHSKPSAVETVIARTMRGWAVPADLRRKNNPVPRSDQVMASARAHWADHCAVCHGNDGKGQTAIGQRVYPPAPDMTLDATQSLSDGALFAIIENGVRLTAMPGWGDGTAESARGSWELVHLVRHLPELTSGEIAEMERLNPRSPAEWQRMMVETSGEAAPAPAAHHDH